MSSKLKISAYLCSVVILIAVLHGISLFQNYKSVRLANIKIIDRGFTPTNAAQVILLLGDSRIAQWSPLPAVERYSMVNLGISGGCSADMLLQLIHTDSFEGVGYAIIQMGINELKMIAMYPEKAGAIIENMKKNIQKSLEILQKNKIRVILLPVLPPGQLGIRSVVWSDQVNESIRKINIFFESLENEDLQVPEITSMLDETGMIKPIFQKDTLHLNQTGYIHLNEVIMPIIVDMSKGKTR